MNLSEFNDNYFLLGNFNMELLKYKHYAGKNGFLDPLFLLYVFLYVYVILSN